MSWQKIVFTVFVFISLMCNVLSIDKARNPLTGKDVVITSCMWVAIIAMIWTI